MKQRLKHLLFHLLGKDPEAVVVTFLTGERAGAMEEEVRRLIPDRRHVAVPLEPGTTWQLYRRMRRQFRRYRIGMAAVLFTPERQYTALRRAAFLLAPTRILAYNTRLERHHLRARTAIASWLFLRGAPLDRIFLRPRSLFPWKNDRSRFPEEYRVLEGRPLSPGRRRVAVLSPYFPYPLTHGGAVRIFHLLREAAGQFDIFLFAFSEPEHEEYAPVLEFCAAVVLVPKSYYREPRWSTLAPPEACEYRSPAMRELLDRFRRERAIELVQVEYTHLARYGGDVLVAHDVTFDLHHQVYTQRPNLARWWNWWRWRRFELKAARAFRRVVFMSEKDAGLLPGAKASVIGNGVDLERFQPEPETPGRRLLFVGSFRHFPNVAAYRFFNEQVGPLLQGVSLTVVAGPDPLVHWQSYTGQPELPAVEGVRVLGFVRDVRPLYVETNLVIVPTLVSAGTNLKVLEAMAMERAVVSTAAGCAGLGLEHGASVWIAETAAEFAGGIERLLGDDALRAGIARAARRHAERHYGWRALGAAQRELWAELLAAPVEVRAARERDLEAIARIQAASPEAVAWEPRTYLAYGCRVAVAQRRVAGFIVTRGLGDEEGEILNLAVDPAFRRRGIARRLIEEAVASGGRAWFLEVRESNALARNLYVKLGFQETGRRPEYYRDNGEAAVVMRLQKW